MRLFSQTKKLFKWTTQAILSRAVFSNYSRVITNYIGSVYKGKFADVSSTHFAE